MGGCVRLRARHAGRRRAPSGHLWRHRRHGRPWRAHPVPPGRARAPATT
jgi:hypothetical protein